MASQDGKIWVLFNSQTKQRSQPLSRAEMQMNLFTMKVKDLELIFIWTPGWSEWQPLKQFLSSDQKHFAGVNPDMNIKKVDEKTIPEFSVTRDLGEVTRKIERESITRDLSEVTRKVEKARTVEVASIIEKPKRTKTDDDITQTDYVQLKDVNNEQPKKKKTAIVDDNKSYTVLVGNDEFSETKYNEEFFRPDISGDDLLNSDLSGVKPKDLNLSQIRNLRVRADRHEFKIEVLIFIPNGKTLKSFSKNISLTGTLIEDNIPFDFQNKNFDIVLLNRFEKDPKLARLTLKGKVVGQGTSRRVAFLDMNEVSMGKLEKLLASYLLHRKSVKTA